MKTDDQSIITFVFYAKRLGVAVFRRTELLCFAVKTLPPPRTESRIKTQILQIVKDYIEEFEPNQLIFKTPAKQQVKSNNFRLVERQIKIQARNLGIAVQEISFETVEKAYCNGRKANKITVFKDLSHFYPELNRLVNYQNKWQAEYYNSLLSAVATGYYYQSNLQNRKSI